MKCSLYFVIVFLIFPFCFALENGVNDAFHYLTPSEVERLNSRISDIKTQTGVDTYIFFVEKTNGMPLSDYVKTLMGLTKGIALIYSMGNLEGFLIYDNIGSTSEANVINMVETSKQFFNKKEYFSGFNYVLSNLQINKQINSNSVDSSSGGGQGYYNVPMNQIIDLWTNPWVVWGIVLIPFTLLVLKAFIREY